MATTLLNWIVAFMGWIYLARISRIYSVLHHCNLYRIVYRCVNSIATVDSKTSTTELYVITYPIPRRHMQNIPPSVPYSIRLEIQTLQKTSSRIVKNLHLAFPFSARLLAKTLFHGSHVGYLTISKKFPLALIPALPLTIPINILARRLSRPLHLC